MAAVPEAEVKHAIGAEEDGATVLTVAYLKSWLGEWSREVRRRQQGLLLTVAHSAKGLQFDHVVVLDGKWNFVGEGEDSEAPRRLYYVAMTRARQTLALLQVDDAEPHDARDRPLAATGRQRAAALIRPLVGAPCILERAAPKPDLSDRRLEDRAVVCSMGDVFLDFAGRKPPRHQVHRAIAELESRDPLILVKRGDQWLVLDGKRRQVGLMARRWTLPEGMDILSAEVEGIFVRWAKDQKNEQFAGSLEMDCWEVVAPRLTLTPKPATPFL